MNYKSFKISENATLRVRSDRIIGTVSSAGSSTVELYVAGFASPWLLTIDNNHSTAEIVDYIWDVKEEN